MVPVSKPAAHQRAGRAGRTGPGVCLRLYSAQVRRGPELYISIYLYISQESLRLYSAQVRRGRRRARVVSAQ